MYGSNADPGVSGQQRSQRGWQQKSQNAWKWLIGYDHTEANRLGVPTVSSRDWLAEIFSNPGGKASEYLDSLFPFTRWIGSYNSKWFIGDLIAGITVGLVVVPQSMSYAQVATLAPEYGLYSSFVGVMIYVLFATSKDVTIGPVAVMSLQTANVIRDVMSKTDAYSAPEIATALAFICGVVCLGIGLLRLGWIVEFIPTPAVSGFMTGSAFTIAAGQVPKLMGLNVNTRTDPTYKVIVNTFKALPETNLNAAFGLPALAFLYAVRSFCQWLPRRYPKTARWAFFASVLRNAFVIIVLTIVSRVWVGENYKDPKKYPISILKTVPSGFQHMGEPNLSTSLLSDLAGQIPVSTIVLLLEHIAISKSFGRLNNYKINPNQELIAIGVTNTAGSAFGAYAATGSFSRSAIKSKSGVRTPLAGWVTGVLVLIALYALTGSFYWIPNAALSAVIIHAVGDLIATPRVLYKFWLVSPFELIIWFAAVLVTVFSSVENGVYTSVAASLALLLIRIARPRGRWLGTVKVHNGNENEYREVFVPLDDQDGLRDPSIRVDPPPPGVLVYRFEEAYTYPNASHLADLLIERAKQETRPGRPLDYAKPGDRPWNDPGPPNPVFGKIARAITCRKNRHAEEIAAPEKPQDPRPLLRAFVFDFSSVSNVDTTSIQTLVDVRTAVELWADAKVEFHFANILSPWIRRGLLAGGFGTGTASRHVTEVAPVVYQREAISTSEALQREQDEAARRANAIERALLRNPPAYPFRPRKQELSELEAGLAGDRDFASRTNLDLTTDDRIEAVPELNNDGGKHYPGDGKGSNSATSTSTGKDALAEEEQQQYPTNGSSVSVPVIWANDLTPFFHLDLAGALDAARAGSLSERRPR